MKKLMTLITLVGVLGFNSLQAKNLVALTDTATKNFVLQASIGGLQEVKSGDIAIQKSQSQEIKNFAKMMVMDHTKANKQLEQLATSKGYQIPPQVKVVVADIALTQNTGTQFDRNYVDMMVAAHQSTIHLFENYATVGKDPDIKAFAQQTLPTLKEHLAAIRAIAAKMNTYSK